MAHHGKVLRCKERFKMRMSLSPLVKFHPGWQISHIDGDTYKRGLLTEAFEPHFFKNKLFQYNERLVVVFGGIKTQPRGQRWQY